MTILGPLFKGFTALLVAISVWAPLAGADTRGESLGVCAQLVATSSRVHTLFDSEKRAHKNYENIINVQLQAGDILRFSNGKEFLYERTLGRGYTTMVLAVRPILNGVTTNDSYALRIPVSDKPLGAPSLRLTVRSFINKFYDGYDTLVDAGVRVPAIHDHLSEEYNLVDLLTYDLNGFDFFAHPERFDPALLARAEAELYRFARSVYKFQNIGDFKAEQLVYQAKENRWLLIDWTDHHMMISDRPGAVERQHPFDTIFYRHLREYGTGADRELRTVTARELKILGKLEAAIIDARGQPLPGRLMRLRLQFGI